MNIVFFKRPKPRQFNYQPLYYDPAKEEAEARKKARNSLKDSDDPREHMRAEIRRKWGVERSQAGNKNQMVRSFIYFIFAIFIIYILFFTDIVTKMVSLFLR